MSNWVVSTIGDGANTDNMATAVSGDGSVIVGITNIVGDTPFVGFVSIDGSLNYPEVIGSGNYFQPTAVSYDGNTVVGFVGNTNSSYNVPVKWTSEGDTVALSLPSPYFEGGAAGASANGNTIVGYVSDGTIKPVAWINGTLTFLDNPFPKTTTIAISADGSKIIGHSSNGVSTFNSYGVEWSLSGGSYGPATQIGPVEGIVAVDLAAISFDGSVIAGSLLDSNNVSTAFYTSSGTIVPITSDANTDVRAISGDGLTIGGQYYNFSNTSAMIWSVGDGMTLLPGINGEGCYASSWTIGGSTNRPNVRTTNNPRVHGISYDGSFVVGTAGLAPVQPWTISSKTTEANEGGIGDLWMDQQYVDFSNTTTRRNFINEDKSWVSFGTYGDVFVNSTYPLVWDAVPTDEAPHAFLYGYGQDGGAKSWSLIANGNDPTTGSPYPADVTFDICDEIIPPEPTTTYLLLSHLKVIETAPKDGEVNLRWSDDRGASWNNPISKSMGGEGDYDVDVAWRRLGQSRDRVFEVSWTTPAKTSLTGAWIVAEKAIT